MRRKRHFKDTYQLGGELDIPKVSNVNSPMLSSNNIEPDNLTYAKPNTTYGDVSTQDIAVNRNNVLGENQEGGINATNALQYLPDALNLATGLFGEDKTRPATQINQRAVGMMPENVNVNPQLQDARASYRAILADPNASGAQKLAAQAQLNRSTSKIQGAKINQENRLQSNKAQLQGEFDSRQAQFDAQYRDDKQRSDANLGPSGNFARQALSSISSKYLKQQAIKAKKEQDKQSFGAIISSLPKSAQERLLKWYEV